MIPAIGYIIGTYVIARSLEMYGASRAVVRIFALIAIVVSILMIGVLLMNESAIPTGSLR